jgi:outer membrane protein assembly factor BamD
MKRIVYILPVVLFLFSCSEYQKVMKQKEIKPKFDMANALYAEGVEDEKSSKLNKAIRLYEQIEAQLQGKPQAQIVQFNLANALYHAKYYSLSAAKFERFRKAYPNSQKVEEAYFKSAECLYQESPVYSLDQADTNAAIFRLQAYINDYPEGEYFDKANEYLRELRLKLEKKYYEIAKQYHFTYQYKAAISDFDNYLINYPGSAFKEKAFYYKFESAYLLAINSFQYLVEERLEEASTYYDDYIERYPEGEFAEQINTYKQDIDDRLTEINNNKIVQQ